MKAETLLVFFVAAIFLQSKNVYGFNGNRILNGTNSPPGSFEFLPKIFGIYFKETLSSRELCSSTIISSRHILTAAHCIYVEEKDYDAHGNIRAISSRTQAFLVDYRPENRITVTKTKKIVDGKEMGEKKTLFFQLKDYSIQSKFYIHPSYTTTESYIYDIAIIEFPEGTELGITPITLVSDFKEKDGNTAIAAGYGVYIQGMMPNGAPVNPKVPDVLLNVTVALHTPQNCKDYPGTAPTALCTGTVDYRAAQGDSGGPLMIQRNGNYYQIGVTSFGKYHNALYTRISMTCDWIAKVTKGAAECKPLPDVDPNYTNSPPQPTPVNPPAPTPAPGPSQDGTTTQAASNSNATDEAGSQAPVPDDKTETPHHEPQNSKSNVAFTFNIVLLFLFFGIF